MPNCAFFVLFASVLALSSGQWSSLEAPPYPVSGWRPPGPAFNLPLRQRLQQVPQAEYGPPAEEYGPPKGDATTTEQPTTTEEVGTTTEGAVALNEEGKYSGDDDDDVKNGKVQEEEAVTQQGVYYIYHPTGLLQKIVYATRDDARNMAYTAQLKYQNVEPIRGPIYTYDPQTLAFKLIGA